MTIGSKEELIREVNKEVGDAKGILEARYREWCVDNPDEIFDIKSDEKSEESSYLSRLLNSHNFDDLLEDFEDEKKLSIKNDDKATKYREEGNSKYQQKENSKAIFLYSKSIAFARHLEVLSMGYANRSAVHFNNGNFSSCLLDINRALKSKSYPKHLHYKILERKAKSLIKVGDKSEAKKCFEQTLESLSFSKLATDKLQAFEINVKKQLESLGKLKSVQQNVEDFSGSITAYKLPKLSFPNPNYPCFSNSADVNYTKDKGRHVIATRNIAVGETIGIEDPIVSYMFGKTVNDPQVITCWNCMRSSITPISSPLSTRVMFCDENCLDDAMSTYHPVEENGYPFYIRDLIQDNKEWLMISFRAISQKPIHFYLENQNKFEDLLNKNPQNDLESKHLNGDYIDLLNLISHHDKVQKDELHFMTYVAVFFIQCLKRSDYFNGVKELDNMSSIEAYIGRLMVRIMEIALSNAHQTGRLTKVGDSWFQSFNNTIGVTIEPTLVLMNSSCDPSFTRCNYGRGTALIACKNIKEGEEITDCYYSTYAEYPKSIRKAELLKKYHFECQCSPCNGNWGVISDLPKGLNDIEPRQLKFDLETDLMKAKTLFGKIQKLGATIHTEQKKSSDMVNYKKLIDYYVEFIKILDEAFHPPHHFYVMTHRCLLTCIWVLKGSIVSIDDK